MNTVKNCTTIHLRLTKIDVFWSCNALNDLFNELYVPNKMEDLNLSIFNIIAGINESKALAKHRPCEHKCKFDGRTCNSNQKWNNDICWY